jgi:hypothetical protein
MVKAILATAALVGLALLLGATAYESVVMAPNYGRDIPSSLEHARRFLVRTTPAHYFRVVAPATVGLLIAGLIACWRLAAARWGLLGGLLTLGAADVITFTFHYPRLAVMFKAPLSDDANALQRATDGWAAGNLLRLALLMVAFLFVVRAVAVLSIPAIA